MFGVNHIRENVWWRSFHIQIDNKSKCRGDTLNKRRTKPEQKVNPKKADQIRSNMARVGAEPGQ